MIKSVLILCFSLLLPFFVLSCQTTNSQELIDFLSELDQEPVFPGESPGLIILVHGMNTRANQWPLRFERNIREFPGNESWDIVRISWRPHSDSALLSPAQAREIGTLLGRQLAHSTHDYQVVHGIGHSMAAHLLHALVTTYREERVLRPFLSDDGFRSSRFPGAFIHLTLLDPYVFLPPLRFRYGVRNYGLEVDFLESFYTREDPVILTNSRLNHGVNWVLDDLVPFREDPYQSYFHDYPIRYYEQTLAPSSKLIGFSHSPLAQNVFYDPNRYLEMINQLLLSKGRNVRLRPVDQ